MNRRLTAAAAVAVILASASEFFLINGIAWLMAAIGAVTVVALAGTLTRLAPGPAAFGATVLAGLVAVPMLASAGAWWKLAGTAIIACCMASASRWRPLRFGAGLVTYLAALLLYLNALRASARSYALLVPTRASLHTLSLLVSHGMSQAKYTPPVSETPGVIVLAAASIGLAAIVIDFIAVRLHRPAIAGLPLLVIYLAPLATAAHVQGPWGLTAFVLAAAGYLGLLASDGRTRLRGWGRVISVWHSAGEAERLGTADVAALAATGRRIGVAALCAAVIAPLLLPSLNLHRLFPGNASGTGGVGAVGLPDPVVQLRGMLSQTHPRTVLTYRTDNGQPGQYLHVYVLNYDPLQSKWVLIPPGRKTAVGTARLPQPPGLASYMPQAPTTLHISLEPFGYSSPLEFLPVPYWPQQLHVSGTWWEAADTLMIFSGQSGQQPASYTVTSGQVIPTPALFGISPRHPAALTPYLDFASPVTARLVKIARRITAGQDTPFGKAVALERWFHSGRFSYSLQANLPNSPQGLLDFLTTNPQGFCQQFAFAMAVLARLVGIPSRVAVGYTAGTRRPDGHWVVTTADAHAWPELYFQGAGWLRFEPTPGGNAGQATAAEPPYVAAAIGPDKGSTGPGNPNPGSSRLATPNVGNTGLRKALGAPGAAGTGPQRHRPANAAALAGLIALAMLLLAAGLPGTARIVTRRRRWRAARGDLGLAQAAWQELRADLRDFGVSCRASDSPRAVARRVCSATDDDDVAQQAIGRITAVVERAYYAPAPASARTVRADVASIRRSLASSARWTARWRARLLPASIIGPARAAIARGLGAITGWMPSPREDAVG